MENPQKKAKTSENVSLRPIEQVLEFHFALNTPAPTLYSTAYNQISRYLKEYKRKLKSRSVTTDQPERSIIIQGPAGSGKTYFVRQLALDFQLNLLELNVSTLRNKQSIKSILGEASQTFAIDQGQRSGTIIFLDDIDIVLEPDKGFLQGIDSLLSNTRCPVLMACTIIPEPFRQKKAIKICKIDDKTSIFSLMKRVRDGKNIKFNDIELENLLIKANGNLHTISSYLLLKDLELIYSWPVEVISSRSIKLLRPRGIIYDKEKDMNLNEIDLEYRENLQQLDLLRTREEREDVEASYRVYGYLKGIERYYLKHRDGMDEVIMKSEEKRRNFLKISRENLLHMAEADDYVSYLQLLEKFSVDLQPSYLLRQSRKNSTYLDLFLQKNPNLFITPQ